ncbi:MAG: DNA topoisomerase I [Lachnospiraceae bacterium]|nr:DNA topoisomerase I [Lachnospiraceae bacterium]
MAQRTVALCNGKYIGIESIFTVINGKQINIPDKLKELRKKSQNNELYCPCGCGANLVLVAGDKNLREQHFRIKDSEYEKECQLVTEGRTSVDSKIVLKCWLDDNLHAADLESRVPICSLSDSNRRYEFTFISRERRIALNYSHERINLSDEKLSILEDNSHGIRIIHIVDFMNGGAEGQYPEALMKIQNRQEYCLLLAIDGIEYDKAKMKAVFYAPDLDGLWQEIEFSDGLLKDYRIEDQGQISFKGKSLEELHSTSRLSFQASIEAEKTRREEAERQREAYLKQQAEEEQRREEERRKKHEEWLEQQRIEAEEAEKRREEWLEQQRKEAEEAEEKRKQLAEQHRIAEEKKAEEKRQREEDFKRNLEAGLEQQVTQVRDADGNRWIDPMRVLRQDRQRN